ncbi:ATP11 protein-domain-containing protein [Syncephalis fuscata]|nr:ATP11 protein-domain-containing protein [Syncephalis fuscata]
MLHGRWPRLLSRSNVLTHNTASNGQQTSSQLIFNTTLQTRSASTQGPASGIAINSPAERYASKLKSRVGLDAKQLRSTSAQTNSADYYRQKYADKLKEKAASMGVSVEELEKKAQQERAKREQNTLKMAREKELGEPALPPLLQRPASTTNAKEQVTEEGPNGVKPLDKIVKLELLMDKNTEAITTIWNQHHSSKRGLSAVIPADTYRNLLARAREFPSFILPLPRNEGVEFFWLQFSGHQCYFTSLAEYKLHAEHARPYLILTHYPELMDSKQVVLMRGELGDTESASQSVPMTTDDARLLVYMLQDFYVTGSKDKQSLVERFHRQPETFKFEDLVDAVNRLG